MNKRNYFKLVFMSMVFSMVVLTHTLANADKNLGKNIYSSTCAMCHTTGVMGAPKFGVSSDWKSRIAQGKAVLYEHAIKGFRGKKGMMPARGGKPNLSDQQVKSAVDYMVENAK